MQVVREKEEDPEHSRSSDQHGHESPATVAIEHDAKRQQRVLGTELNGSKGSEQYHRRDETSDREVIAPRGGLGVREAVDQCEQATGGAQHASPVQGIVVDATVFMHENCGTGHAHDREEEIDE